VVFFSGFLKSFSCIVFLSGVTLSFLLPSRFFFFFVCNHLKEKQQQQRLKERNKRETTQIERDCPRSSFLLKSLSQSYSSPLSTTPPSPLLPLPPNFISFYIQTNQFKNLRKK